ncbi:efflux RND transporter periplasmic adaptor subunit [Sedimenticola selenatireducens]|uniref:efflux RND transporter periplasmic adaptor subunit n=1 Tax=Sedimenticola selenatireducens TaxID=191960 RepID=UPI0004BAD638|nr:efflux RND transporter periplasmic adaptor subunit [Sedimenticola selenatireducens]
MTDSSNDIFRCRTKRTFSNASIWPKNFLVARSAAGFILLTALSAIVGCQENSRTDSGKALQPTTQNVALSSIEQRTQPVIYEVPGSVVPAQRLQVTSRISGFIEQIHVDEGDRVEMGGKLVDIDDAQLEAKIRAAAAALASAEADLADARADVERYQSLAMKQVLAEDQLRDARVRSLLASALVEKMQAELDVHREDRRYTRLISPVQALVRERLRDPGDLITAGEPVLRLDVLGPKELEVFIPTTQVDAVTAGQAVKVVFDHVNEHLTGTVIGVVYSADPMTRRYKVRIALPDDQRLSPGQFGTARLRIGEETVLAIPQAAVVNRAGIEGIFVVDSEGKARFRSVRLGRRWGTEREVLAGVEPGNSAVLHPPAGLRDGDRVQQVARDDT